MSEEKQAYLKLDLTTEEVEVIVLALTEGILRKKEEAAGEQREYVRNFHKSYIPRFQAIKEKLEKKLRV